MRGDEVDNVLICVIKFVKIVRMGRLELYIAFRRIK